MSQNVIEVVNFCKSYRHQIAVDQVSFQVAAGQVVGLIGPNGAGKTTTMRALCGIIPSTRGQLRVGGFDIDQQPLQAKRHVAYVPDDPQLFNDLTVNEHFAFTASAYQVQDWRARMQQLLEQFDLQGKINSRAGDLSRGMRQKLAVCCAWLYEPQALLLDEPMTGLDPRGIRMLKRSIQEQADRGVAILISSHLLAMVEDICTDVLVLSEGRIRFNGSLQQLKSRFIEDHLNSTLEDAFFMAVHEQQPVPSATSDTSLSAMV